MQDIINIIDEEGKEHNLEIIDALELNDRQYLALLPIFEDESAEEMLQESDELVILRVSDEQDEDGQEYLEAIEDDAEYEEVAQTFMKRLEEDYDFEDDSEE